MVGVKLFIGILHITFFKFLKCSFEVRDTNTVIQIFQDNYLFYVICMVKGFELNFTSFWFLKSFDFYSLNYQWIK